MSSKITRVPKVATKRTQRNMLAALGRAEDMQDKPKIDYMKNMLNGSIPLPAPNVKKV